MTARRGWRLLVGLLVVALVLGSGLAQAQERKLTAKLADILSPDHPNNRTWVYFADKVKERTQGQLEIQVFHSGQLGQQKDLFLGMQAGNIQMAKMPFTIAAAWVPEAKVFDLPYLFSTREEMWRVLRGPVGARFFQEIYPKVGLVGIMHTDDGGRSFYSHKAIRKPADLKGLKIRVPASEVMIQSINAMGAIGTSTSWAEVYLALQQRVIDGAENSPITLYTSKHWEVSKNFSLTEHFWLPCPLLASKKWWDGLPKDIQAAVTAAGKDAEAYGLKIYAEEEAKVISQLKEKGVQIVTDVDKAAFEKAVQPVYDSFVKQQGTALLTQIRAEKGTR
jgi:tripartite ATP-independent transporter DctP family solute receptor